MTTRLMSRRSGLGPRGTSLGLADLQVRANQILTEGIHGLCFSPYLEGQGPGYELDKAQIRERLAVIAPAHTLDPNVFLHRR